MSVEKTAARSVSGQRLPVSLPGPRARVFPAAARPGAAFLAHLLSAAPTKAPPADGMADRLYRQGAARDRKRLPPGFRTSLSA